MALLTNKIVCITGASRGIGRACAAEAAKHGAAVVTVPGDIADANTSTVIVDEGIKAFGRIDVLVSNAGICPFAEFLTMPHTTWERTRQVNLDGAFYVVQAVANQMKKQTPQGGSIIGISSISASLVVNCNGSFPALRHDFLAADYRGNRTISHYTPTKAGILSLMQSCAVALGKYNIRANAILPGTIATDINKDDLSDSAKRDYMIKRTALGRLGEPGDIAGPVVFLASDLAKYVTGASLLVDGGLFVNLQ
ncbi:hypothetical protein BD779DRAFT_1658901 [Infundibulicybe gibba]|nr:hypothetical protein BD779DRAFT_1658901 [Infundibulicybe gibba]